VAVYAKHGIVVRLLYLTVSGLWYLLSAAKFWADGSTVVLCYHGIMEGQRERFRRQVSGMARWSARKPGRAGNRASVEDAARACASHSTMPLRIF